MAVSKKNEADLGDILEEKLREHKVALKEHEEALAVHQREVSFHKERVEYITSVLGNLPRPNKKSDVNDTPFNEKIMKSWYWKTMIPELMDGPLQSKEFKNGEVIACVPISPDILNDKDLKSKITYAVSVALSELVEGNVLDYYKKEGMKGYMYKAKK